MQTLGSEHGMLLRNRGSRERLYQVADACVQRNQSPGETRHCWWFHPITAWGNQRGLMMLLSVYVEVIVFNANIVKCASFPSIKPFLIVVLKRDKTIWLHIRHKYLFHGWVEQRKCLRWFTALYKWRSAGTDRLIHNPLAPSQNHSWMNTSIQKPMSVHTAAGQTAVENIWRGRTPTCQRPSMLLCISPENLH